MTSGERSRTPDEPGTDSSTFLFADLAGFTALTEAHGDAEATEIALDFAANVRAMLGEYEGEEVKTIGDEVMVRVADPIRAIQLGLRIVERLARPGSPPVRVGMHSGPAVARDGDWFGGTVNLASRVAGAARPGEVLLTESTRLQAGEPAEVEFEQRGDRFFKHIPAPIPVYRAVDGRGAGHHLEIDPVCRMAVDPEAAVRARRRRGISYYFCSSECARAFDEDPRRYVASSPAARVARRGFLINLAAFLTVGMIHLFVWGLAPEHEAGSPWMLSLYGVWAGALVIHYRSIRRVL
jgi:adenylate cyclase